MMKCGLLGETLGHSYSPEIHSKLGDYEYKLYEKKPEEVETFLRTGDFTGLNVTIPYKKTVLPILDEISETASAVGSVNTIVRRDGRLIGDNTDVFGFMKMVEHSGISVQGRKTLVLGSGGASVAVMYALETMHALPIVISRTGENNYTNLYKHADAEIIVNTTPVGMYPKVGVSPIELDMFENLKGVLDIIYNPTETELLRLAKERNLPCENGLYMLIAQAAGSSELFTGSSFAIDEAIEKIYNEMSTGVATGVSTRVSTRDGE